MIATSVYSQGSYPKKIVFEGDTLVAITEQHMKRVNKAFVRESSYKQTIDSLGVKVVLLNTKSYNDSVIISKLKQDVSTMENINKNNLVINDRLKSDLESTDNELNKVSRKSKWQKVLLGVSVAVNVVLTIVLISK